jgi:serine/threonine protein kinase/tetratricopeptide (TPR) repeat protein
MGDGAIRLAPFELKNVCGRGGMAEVWRALHVEQGIPVAVKVMTDDHAREPHFLQAFANEVRSMARLHHPNIVTVLDFGVIDEAAEAASGGRLRARSPYLAMEYASGGTLAKTKGGLEFDVVLDVLLALLDALAHAHARGVLHRDLKPANILLAGPSDLRRGLKLTDFGIAHTMEEEREPDQEQQSSGTPQYMAPEQFFARWRDYGPWTDLYALGCIAFFLTTGRLPFTGEIFTQLAVQHIRDPVPELVPRHPVPDGFEAWVRRLLEKNPRERFQLAADASWALASLARNERRGGSAEDTSERSTEELEVTQIADSTPTLPWAAKTITTDAWQELQQIASRRMSEGPSTIHRIPPIPESWRRETPSQPPLRLLGAGLGLYGLRSIPIVDREAERDSIWGALRRVRETGRANLVMLLGPAGNGKSRIAEWMSQRAHEVGTGIVMKAVHGPNGGPRDGIAGMIAKHLRCTGLARADTEKRIEEILRGLGETSEHEWSALAELIHPSDAAADRAIRLVNATERHVVARRLLERAAIQRPVIVWLEDVHWGGDALAFAIHVLKAQLESPAPITFLLTAREDLLAEQPIEASLIEHLRSFPESEIMDVQRLNRMDHRALVGDLLGLQGALADLVAERTDGNPLFAVQLVGDWVQRGVLELEENGFTLRAGEEVPLPDDLHAVWSHRIDAVLAREGLEARVALELAAVLGTDVDADEWALACARSNVPVPSELLSELLRRRLCHPAENGWSFAHGMLRESLYRSAIDAGRFHAHHASCAEMLLFSYGVESPMSERIARHLVAAERFREALAPLVHRVKSKLAAGEYAEADALLELYGEALEKAAVPRSDERWGEHHVLRARTFTRRGNLAASREWIARAEEAAAQHGWKSVLAEALFERGSLAYEENDQGAALDRYEEARRSFESIGLLSGVARCLSAIGDSRYRLGNLEGASHRYQGALDIFTRISDTNGSLSCLWGLGYVYMWKGQLDRAQAVFERQLGAAEQSGNRHYMARALSALAEVARMTGEFATAEKDYRRAIELFQAVGSPEVDMGALNLGLLLVWRRDFASSREHLESIWSRIERSGDRLKICYLHMQLLPSLSERREWAMWDLHFDKVRRLSSEMRLHDGDVAELLMIVGEVTAASGERERALSAYEIALAQWRGLRRSDKVAETERLIASLS